MPQSLVRMITHIIFSTKNRTPLLSDMKIQREMHAYLAQTCKELNCLPITAGGTSDHVHIICNLSNTMTISKLIGESKRISSKWIKTKGGMLTKFQWQSGYGAYSVSQSGLNDVRKYVLNQEEHHRKVTFKEEFRRFLGKYQVKYDERYVWD